MKEAHYPVRCPMDAMLRHCALHATLIFLAINLLRRNQVDLASVRLHGLLSCSQLAIQLAPKVCPSHLLPPGDFVVNMSLARRHERLLLQVRPCCEEWQVPKALLEDTTPECMYVCMHVFVCMHVCVCVCSRAHPPTKKKKHLSCQPSSASSSPVASSQLEFLFLTSAPMDMKEVCLLGV